MFVGQRQLVVLCAVVGFLWGCTKQPSPPAPPPPEVDVAKPIVREVIEWDEFTGRLAAIDTVEVRPRVSGYLESVHFREGQIVTKGDLLFVIDPRPFRAVLAAAEADVAGAQSRLELARNDLQRSENLVRTGAVSAEDFDRRSKAAVEAQASLDSAKARLDQAKLDVEFTEVRAPINGRTSNYAVTVGNLVSGGAASQATLLTTIVSLDPIHCYIDASEQEYLKYTRLAESGSRPSSRDKPNPVRIALIDENDFRHEGAMDFVDNRIDPFTGTMRGRAVLNNPEGTLVPGLFVRLRLIGETKAGAVLIPDNAIGTDQANRIVYVVDEKNTVTLRTVKLGRLIDGLRVISSGLNGEERVVVSGLQRARPGATVTPHEVDLDATASASAATAPDLDRNR
jgi:RND family efflux transporter MFP subunit